MIHVFSILNTPPYTINVHPEVDYKVLLDMQLNYLANAQENFGLYGVMLYQASYSDEETIRWAGRLFRHYCIEGNTDLLSERYGYKYRPGHIRNPDFDQGLDDWAVSEAEPGSVTTASLQQLGRLLGRRHARNAGNHCLRMKRSANRPNTVSQEIRNLKPGKLYCMKMIVADFGAISKGRSVNEVLAASIKIDNVQMLRAKGFVSSIQNVTPRSGQFKGKPPPWMNYHWKVFRAKGKTAKLVISDWASDAEPGGPAGQELLINFIEIQPYFE